jgi:hypothetical protein
VSRDTESMKHDRDGLLAKFAAAVSSLADGELTHHPPFDLSSSAALADNIDAGGIAQHLFDVTAQRDTGYTVVITSKSVSHPDLGDRPVIDTQVASTRLLIALLETFLDELYARNEEQ